ncbi:unnamed protein product [Pedinophyceae sp. YPF-701]|nr:unnamed protein product [Pedinophyceae sp. YPF-701]
MLQNAILAGASRLACPATSTLRPRTRTVARAEVADDRYPKPPRGYSERFNVIEKSRWESGIPPVMGAHLMASGAVAPLSTSTGPGTGVPMIIDYPGTEVEVAVSTFTNAKAGAVGLAKLVVKAAEEAIAKKGSFSLALSGGSLLNALPAMHQLDAKPDFAKWHIFYADERCVPHSSPDSNHGAAKKAFLDGAAIPVDQIHAIREDLSPDMAAKAYQGDILGSKACPNVNGIPQIDLILLGIGPDGHVASLFPHRPQVGVKDELVVEITDSPKPPPERITMTLPLINNAKEVFVVAMGKGKAEIAQRALEVQAIPGALPAQLVRPTSGGLRWLLDLEAATEINPELWDSARAHPRSIVPK